MRGNLLTWLVATAIAAVAATTVIAATPGRVLSQASTMPPRPMAFSGPPLPPAPRMASAPAPPPPLPPRPAPSASPSQTGPSHYRHPIHKFGLDLPAGWYRLRPFGEPPTIVYFANEIVDAPILLSPDGVWLTIRLRDADEGNCASQHLAGVQVSKKTPLLVDGYPTNLFMIERLGGNYVGTSAFRSGRCYEFAFYTKTAQGREIALTIINSILKSFKFGPAS